MPEQHRQVLNQGRVLEKGPFCTDSVSTGDVVFFPFHSESRTGEIDGKKYLLISEGQCLGKIHTTEVKD